MYKTNANQVEKFSLSESFSQFQSRNKLFLLIVNIHNNHFPVVEHDISVFIHTFAWAKHF